MTKRKIQKPKYTSKDLVERRLYSWLRNHKNLLEAHRPEWFQETAWTLETALQAAQKWKRGRATFAISSPGRWLHQNGHWHRIDKWIPPLREFWTATSALKEMKKYSSRKDLVQKSGGLYAFLMNNPKLKAAFIKHLPPKKTTWTVESALEHARQFSDYRTFSTKYPGAVRMIKDAGKLDLLLAILPRARTISKWTEEQVLAEARKYPSREAFKKSAAYAWLQRRKKLALLDKILPRKLEQWTQETALAEMRKYRSRYEFKQRSAAYQWVIKNDTARKIMEKHLPKIEHEWTWDQVIKVAKSCSSRYDFMKNQSAAYQWASSKGIHRVWKILPKSEERQKSKLTVAEALELAKEYPTISAFAKAEVWAYRVLKDHKELLYQILRPRKPGKKSALVS